MGDDLLIGDISQFMHQKHLPNYLQKIHLIGWQPTYLDNQVNASLVLYEGTQEECFVRSAQQIYRDLVRFHCLDVSRLRNAFEDAVGKTQYLPLLIPASTQVFSPLKCRARPYNRNDGATGYFNPKYVEHVKACRNDTTDIYFKGGHKINVYMTSKRVKERFQESLRFQDLFAYRHGNSEIKL